MEYKIIIYGQGIYKEVPLKDQFQKGFLMGTDVNAHLRFVKQLFNIDFWIKIENLQDRWMISCDDTVYLKMKNSFKEYVQYPAPGDLIYVCNNQTEEELFCLDFSVDFGEMATDFNKRVACNQKEFRIGGVNGSEIQILDTQVQEDVIQLKKEKDGYTICTDKCRYGIYVNGCQTKEKFVKVHNYDFFSLNGYQFYVDDDWLYFSENIALDTRFYVEVVQSVKNHLQYPKFIRSVRQLYQEPKDKLEVLSPKALPQEPQKNLIMSIVPLVISVSLTVVLRGMMGSNGVYMIYCVATMLVSAVMSVWNYRNQGKKYKEQCEHRITVYENYLLEQENKIQQARIKEQMIAREKSTILEEQIRLVEDFDSRLFEIQRTDDDYLSCYIGMGTIESACQIQYKEEEYLDTVDPLMDCPKMLHDKYQYIDDMPILVNLKDKNAVGIIGERGKLYQLAKNITLSLAITHFYKDIKFIYILAEEDQDYFVWARWLQNTINDGIGIKNFIYDEESQKIILEYLYSELSRRESMKEDVIAEQEPHYIIFVYRSECISTHPISNYIESAAKMGFTFIFFEEYAEYVNKNCSTRIFLETDSNEGYIQNVEDGEAIQRFYYPHISREQAAVTALRLGCVYVDEVSLESSLTKNISLFQLLNIQKVNDLQLETRWANSKIYDTMSAPLGVKSGDEIVCLDLHEKYHGPHGLVAGTTGSGKSEILQTYILSMATLFHPYEVGFIIIDFKGGGMVNQFRNLPHLNGAITNIDGKEIDRSLMSIRAELRKRQELFAEHAVNHIDDYIKLFKKGEAKLPLPHLILIVDEFAELKSEQPEFMKELISAARIGRSLGVHLILATQKPAGVVNDQIWSNSKFKLCLKVQTKEDSNEVLKSPLAAEIREPGRAYLQVGNNEIFQLFQSAYSGAAADVEEMGDTKAFQICKVDLAGRKTVVYEQKPPKNKSNVTQLDALVEYIHNYCSEKNIQKLQDICLPSLEYKIPYTLKGYVQETQEICVPIGYYDNPSRQLQTVTGINLSQNHVYVVGSSQYGKTNFLQCLVRGLVQKYNSDEICLYILDFASMILKNFDSLKCVGGVVTAREEEKLKAFLKMMLEESERRKNLLAEMGLSSFAAYREAGYTDLPQIVVLVDNIGAIRELFPKYEDSFLTLCRDGVAIGISIVVTTSQVSAIGYKFLSNFGKRIALYCNESSEYGHAFDHCRMKPDNKPGRCLVEVEKEIFEGQIYLAFAAEREVDKIEQIREFIKEYNQKYQGKLAKRIPEIPAVVSEAFIEQRTAGMWNPYEVVSGVNYSTTEFDYLKLLQTNVVGIASRDQETSDKFLKYIITAVSGKHEQAPVRIHILDSISKGLEVFKEYETCANYSYDPSMSVSYIKTVSAILKDRYTKVISGDEEFLKQEPLHLIIINSADSYAVLSSDFNIVEEYKRMIGKYRTMKFAIILAQLPNANMNYNAASFIKASKDLMNLYLFFNLNEQKVYDIPLSIQREYSKPIEATDAYNICAGNMEKIKTPVIQ